jgi:hypothetical protein
MQNGRMRNLLPVAFFALALIQADAAIASETWYRWLDSQGTAHLESSPPGSGISYELVPLPEPIQRSGRPVIPAAVADASHRFLESLLGRTSDSVYPVVLGASSLPEAPDTVSGSAVAISGDCCSPVVA